MTMPADRERDRRSLQDLAKMAQSGLTPPPPSAGASVPGGVHRATEGKADDSGMIDLRAAVASDPGGAARAASTPLASQGLFDEDPQSVRPPPSAHGAQQPMPSMPPASMPPASMPHSAAPSSAAPTPSFAPAPSAHASASSSAALQQGPQKRGGAVIALVLGGVVALGAAAAGTFFYLKSQKAPEAPVAAAPAAPEATTPAPAEPAATTAAAEPSEPATDGEPSMDPNGLPTATPDPKLALGPKTAPRVTGGAKPEGPKAEAKLTQKDLPPAQTGPAGALGEEMAKAVGDDGKPKKAQEPVPAAGSNVPAGSVPQKPSQGAVTGAIGAVLPQARACLGPDDPVSHASIVFGSDGVAQSVKVTGGAAGKPAEACIKTALMKAKVGPFAESSYSTRITVRH